MREYVDIKKNSLLPLTLNFLKVFMGITIVTNWSLYLESTKKSIRKLMINLDSILKTRDITLLAKVHIDRAIVFPVVMHGCENWTIKKAEC